jgi:ABC-2 type transport system ATP-binding protein
MNGSADRRSAIERVKPALLAGRVHRPPHRPAFQGHEASGWAWPTRLLCNPKVLVLDEPTIGLDPTQIRETRNLIRELGEDHTILFSSHILSEVEQVCTRIIIIAGGKLIARGTPDELRATKSAPSRG